MYANIQDNQTHHKISDKLKNMLAVCLLAGSVVSLASAATTPEFYVATTGSDSRTSAQAQNRATPWKTIQKAAANVTPGAVVHVAPGTYSSLTTISRSGNATARITFISDTKWGAKIKGSSKEALLRVDGKYIDIKNFEFIGTGPILEAILVTNSNVRIIGNKVHDIVGTGIETWNPSYTLSNIDVLNNIVYNTGNDAQDHGIYLMHQGGNVSNNIVYNAAGYGIHCWHAANALVISNNLVFDNPQGGIIVGAGDAPYNRVADNFVVTNNISAFNGKYGIFENGKTGRNNVYRNNLAYQNGWKNIYLKNGNAAQYTLTKNPGLVNLNGGNFKLASNSPAINAGTQLGAQSADFDGTARTGNPDIGPYEYK